MCGEGLVKTQGLVLQRFVDVVDVVEVVAILVEDEVSLGVLACVEQTEVVVHGPLAVLGCGFALAADHHAQADCSRTVFDCRLRHYDDNAVGVLAMLVELLAGIVHVLLDDVQTVLLVGCHVACLAERCSVESAAEHHRFAVGACVLGVEHACYERSLVCCREALALYDVCAGELNGYVLVDDATVGLYACAVELAKVALVRLNAVRCIFAIVECVCCLRKTFYNILFTPISCFRIELAETERSEAYVVFVVLLCSEVVCLPVLDVVVATLETRTLQHEREVDRLGHVLGVLVLKIVDVLVGHDAPCVVACQALARNVSS